VPYPRSPDFIERHLRNTQRIRDLETRPAPSYVESFILDPVSVRAWPPAIAVFSGSTIFGVALYHTSPSAITVAFRAGEPGSADLVHTFGSASNGIVHSAFGDELTYGEEYEMGSDQIFYPEITAGAGGAVTAAFMIT